MFKRTAWLLGALVLVCCHLWMFANLPAGSKDLNTSNSILHNWHEYGFWHLHGQLVANVGGLDAGEKPFVYPGHRPYLLLLPYGLKELPGTAGGNGLLYDLVMVLATYAGLTRLLGTEARGVMLASIVCLSPGFIQNIIQVDLTSFPETVALAVLPFAAGRIVDGEKPAGRALTLAILMLFMLMNWSTLFPLFVTGVYLCARRPAQWKNLAVYLVVALVVGLGIFAVSIMNRHQYGTTSSTFWNAYLWGPAGYDGNGMTLGRALIRILAVSVIAWLPLAVGGFVLWLRNGLGERWRLAPLPLAAALCSMFLIRNHSAHHPWFATPVIGLGLLFSLELLIAPQPGSKRRWSAIGIAAAAAFCLVYCASWLVLNDFNKRDYYPLYDLIEQNTPRHSLIVVTDSLTPDGLIKPEALSTMVDRKCMGATNWEIRRDGIEQSGQAVFFLTHGTPPPGARLVAQSQCPPRWTDRIMIPLFGFYREKVSRRAPGQRMTFFTEYQLYQH